MTNTEPTPPGSPCENDGICVNTPGHYRCDCAPGFTGPRCEVSVNECDSNPCQNKGTCLDQRGGYKCICMPGKSVSVGEEGLIDRAEKALLATSSRGGGLLLCNEPNVAVSVAVRKNFAVGAFQQTVAVHLTRRPTNASC